MSPGFQQHLYVLLKTDHCSLEPYGLLGQAAFPWDYEGNPLRDGIILRFTSLPGGSELHYNLGKVSGFRLSAIPLTDPFDRP